MSELSHYGKKGMKWGVRKEKKLQSYNRVAAGKTKVRDVLRLTGEVSLLTLAKNKGNVKKIAAGRAAVLQAQKSRFESGKPSTADKFDRVFNTPIVDLVLNR